MNNKDSIFIIATLVIQLVALLAGSYFFGLQYTVILGLLWTFGWLGFCSALQRRDEARYRQACFLKLVLLGGPLCWVICPWALLPKKHERNAEPVPWIMLLKFYQMLEDSVLRLMRIVFSLALCEPEESPGSGSNDQ